jgi:hypothetical protein
VHLILANPPWRQLLERAQKIQGDKKHVEGFSRRVIALRSSIEHRIVFSWSVVRQFVVPDMKRISFCLAQALRFGIAG